MRMLFPAAAFAALAVAAPAQAPDADAPPPLTPELAKALAGRTPGKPVDCVWLRQVRSSEIFEKTAIIYKLDSKRWLVNFFDGGCPMLRREYAISTRTSTNQLCRGDIATIVDKYTPITVGSCGMGRFVPYEK